MECGSVCVYIGLSLKRTHTLDTSLQTRVAAELRRGEVRAAAAGSPSPSRRLQAKAGSASSRLPCRPLKTMRTLVAVAVVAVVALLPAAAVATNYTVGDEKGWNPDVDYTAWVKKHRPFYKGDWLLFEYQNGRSDVVQVDEVGYDNCDKANAISSYSKGHSYAFQLKEAKDYFFICSYGYCYNGMKLAVTAKKGPASSDSSSGSGSGSSSKSATASAAATSSPLAPPYAALLAVALLFFRML